MENISRKIIIFLVYLSLLTPLVMGRFGLTLSAYPKAVFFRILVELMLIFYIFLVLINNKKYLFSRISPLFIIILIFNLVLIITSIFGVNFYRSFFGDPERAEGIVLQFHLLAYFLIIISIFDKKEKWFNLFRTAIIVSGISSLAGIAQKLNIYHFYGVSLPQRISGTLSNPDFFAPYIVSSIFIIFFMLFVEKNKQLKNIWHAILFLNVFSLILSGTRGAWVGMIAGLVSLCPIFYIYYSNLKKQKRLYILSGLLLASLFLLAVFLNPGIFNLKGNYYFETFYSIFELDLGSRADIWNLSINAFRDKPILGWGTESYSYIYDKYFKNNYLKYIPENLYFDHPHNKLLEILTANGLVGAINYVLIYIFIIYLLFKNNKNWEKFGKNSKYIYSWALSGFFVSYFFQNIFFFDTICNYITFFLVAGFINNNFSDKKNDDEFSKKISAPKIIIFSVSVFAILAIVYQLNIKPTKYASMFPNYAQYENRDIKKSFSGYKKALENGTIYDKDFRLIFIERMLYLLENNKAKKIEKEVVDSLVELETLLKKDIESGPDRRTLNSYEYLIRTYQRIYMFTKDEKKLIDMESALADAIKFNNEIPVYYQLLGELKLMQNDYYKGESYFYKMYELTPQGLKDKAAYHKKMGVAYLKIGDEKKAIEQFDAALDTDYYSIKYSYTPVLDDVISIMDTTAIMHYKDYGDFESCEKIYNRGIETYPQYQKLLENHLETIKKDHNNR